MTRWEANEASISELVDSLEECEAFIAWCRDKFYFTKSLTYELIEQFRADRERKAFYINPISIIDGELD
jgi:hypothetical protein